MILPSLAILLAAVLSHGKPFPAPLRIDIAVLKGQAPKLLGKRIVTRACMVHTHHGDFIQPCGSSNWHEIIPVLDPGYRIGDAYAAKNRSFASALEGTIFGVLIESEVDGSGSVRRVFLQIDDISDVRAVGPDPRI